MIDQPLPVPAEATVPSTAICEHRQFVLAGLNENTLTSYRSALKRFDQWRGDRPASDGLVAEYLRHLFEQGKAKSSAGAIVAALNKLATLNDVPSPIGNVTREALKSYRRQARARGRGSMTGLRFEHVDLATSRKQPGLLGLRNACLLRVLSDGMLRVSELCALELRDVATATDGSGTLKIRHSKTDQDGSGATVYLGTPTVQLLHRWIKALRDRGITDGKLFRSVKKGERIIGASLSTKAVRAIVKQQATEIGQTGNFGSHSCRIGSAESLADKGATLTQLMQVGRWSNSAMPAHYTRQQRARSNAMARLRYQR